MSAISCVIHIIYIFHLHAVATFNLETALYSHAVSTSCAISHLHYASALSLIECVAILYVANHDVSVKDVFQTVGNLAV